MIFELVPWSQGGALDMTTWRSVGGMTWWNILSRDPMDAGIDKTKYMTPYTGVGTPPGNDTKFSGGVERWRYKYPDYFRPYPPPFTSVYAKMRISSTVSAANVGVKFSMIHKRLWWYGDAEPEVTGVIGKDHSAVTYGLYNIATEAAAVVRQVDFIPHIWFNPMKCDLLYGLSYYFETDIAVAATIKIYAFRLYLVEGAPGANRPWKIPTEKDLDNV